MKDDPTVDAQLRQLEGEVDMLKEVVRSHYEKCHSDGLTDEVRALLAVTR